MELGPFDRVTGNDGNPIGCGGVQRTISMKAKMVKMTEFWGAAEPIQPVVIRGGNSSSRRNSSVIVVDRIAEVGTDGEIEDEQPSKCNGSPKSIINPCCTTSPTSGNAASYSTEQQNVYNYH